MKRNIRDLLKNANALNKDGEMKLKSDIKVLSGLPLTGVFPAAYIGSTCQYAVKDVLRNGEILKVTGDKDGRHWNIYDGEVHKVRLQVTGNDISTCRVLTEGLIKNNVTLKGKFFDSPKYGKGRVSEAEGDRITVTFGKSLEKIYIYPLCIAKGELYTEDSSILSVTAEYAEKRGIDWKAALEAAKPEVMTKADLLSPMDDEFRAELKAMLMEHPGEENEMLYDELVSRNVKWLYHFTRLENLPSILSDGIVPRASLDSSGADYIYNDENRFENMEQCVCLSAGYPNYYYLNRMVSDRKRWVILRLHAGLLFAQKNYYAKHNAAAASVSPAGDIAGFKEMFSESFTVERSGGDPIYLDREGIAGDGFPTSVQAEILAEGTVDPKYIVDVISAEDREGCITDKDMFTLSREEYFNCNI